MLQCESANVAVRFVAAVRFTLRRAILGVIVIPSLLSRFERGAAMDMAIGYFGDARLAKNGGLIASRGAERQTVCISKLADDRREEVKFRRFVANAAVTGEEMEA